MNQHTREPWEYDDGNIIQEGGGDYGYQIAIVDHPHSDFTQEVISANGRRIVACVNACRGASTEVLERGAVNDWAVLMTELEAQLDAARAEARKFKLNGLGMAASFGEASSAYRELQAERDDLLAALEVIANCDNSSTAEGVRSYANKAIAKAKGGAA